MINYSAAVKPKRKRNENKKTKIRGKSSSFSGTSNPLTRNHSVGGLTSADLVSMRGYIIGSGYACSCPDE